jgi:hypothetical protein
LEAIEAFIVKYAAEGVHPGEFVVIRTDGEGKITHVPELVLDYRLETLESEADGAPALEELGGDPGGPGGSHPSPGGDFGEDGTPTIMRWCSNGYVQEDATSCNMNKECSSDLDFPMAGLGKCTCNYECSPMAGTFEN